jgi:voltage-gated potassium channel
MVCPKQQIGVWQYFMLVLSVISILVLAIQTFIKLEPQTRDALWIADTLFCGFFFADFWWQLFHSKPKSAYLKWGWLDLIASIPMFPIFRVARLARIARIIRVLHGVRASKHILSMMLIHRARSTFGAVVFGSFILLLFATIAILNVEPTLSARDAFWWCVFTLITGEYGDFYPATTEGRVITALLMTAGVAIFGTFTATVASYFLEEENADDERRDTETLEKIELLTKEISELRNQIERQNSNG